MILTKSTHKFKWWWPSKKHYCIHQTLPMDIIDSLLSLQQKNCFSLAPFLQGQTKSCRPLPFLKFFSLHSVIHLATDAVEVHFTCQDYSHIAMNFAFSPKLWDMLNAQESRATAVVRFRQVSGIKCFHGNAFNVDLQVILYNNLSFYTIIVVILYNNWNQKTQT